MNKFLTLGKGLYQKTKTVMKQSLQNIFDLIINPKVTFTRLKHEPKWVVVFAIYCLFSFLLAWTLMPYTERLIAIRSVDTVSYSKTRSFISITVMSTVYTILMAISLSVILTITAKITKIKSGITFKHIYAAFFHIMLIRVTTFFVNAGLLPVFRDIRDIQSAVDARVVPGLHWLAGSLQNRHILMFLAYINPLAVWYVFVLTIGIHVLAEVSKTKALFVALIIWLFRATLDVSFVAVFLP